MDKEKKEKNSVMSIDTIAQKRNDPGFFREVWQQARLVYYLLRDPEVPFYLKLLPFTAVIYLLLPLDLVPDMLLGLGQLDDLTALLVSSKVFIEMAPPHVVARHMDQIRANDGLADSDEVNEKIIIDPQPVEKETDQA